MEPRTSQLIPKPAISKRVPRSATGIAFFGRIPRRAERGAALVVVLAFLVLITIMAVAFFTSTTGEAGASKVESDALSVRQLADSSVQYVLSQIRNATSGGTTTAWASQPGAIRTFGSDGNPISVFKLYSASSMQESVPSSGWTASEDLPGTSWRSDKALWTDLNAPVSSGNRTVFPIIDPRAAANPSGKSDPMVDGFSFNATAMPGAVAPTSTDDANARIPMPVRWLYVLKDGRYTTPSGGNGTTANFSGSNPAPTASNPIVGRVAFWTDDETCKLNLNTACGGNYWDVPSFTAGIELHFSRYKPVKNEFARYPGHPATTSLLPVFWSFSDLKSPQTNLFPTISPPFPYKYFSGGTTAWQVAELDVAPTLSLAAREFFTKSLLFNPRNTWGGSQMGSNATVVSILSQPPTQTIDSDRFLSSIDEALFSMPSGNSNDGRPINPFNFGQEDVEKLRFFMTTHSRTPDTNPLNQPKVGIWPIPQRDSKRTPTDKLIAFCSTLNNSTYYFTRNNSESPTADFQAGSRNDLVFDYLTRGLKTTIPGFGGNVGGSLEQSYGAQSTNRLVTNIYDFIRGSVNLADTFGYNGTGTPNHAFTTIGSTVGSGQVVPIRIQKDGATFKGPGRFVTIKQAGLQFIACAANQPPCKIDLATGIPIAESNPMHPWCGDPGPVSLTNHGDGTWTVQANNQYPTISGQTHAGLPLLSNKWISDPAIYTSSNATLRNAIKNPRYHGSSTLYGNGTASVFSDPYPIASASRLGPHQTMIQAIFLIDPVIINPGSPPYIGKYQVIVRGLDAFQADGTSLGFRNPAVQVASDANNISLDFGAGYYSISNHFRSSSGTGRRQLRFESQRVIVGPSTNQGGTFSFSGGIVTVEIRTEPTGGDLTSASNLGQLIQTYEIEIPSATFPTPLLPQMPKQGSKGGIALLQNTSGNVTYTNLDSGRSRVPSSLEALTPCTLLTFDNGDGLAANPNFGVGSTIYSTGRSRTSYGSGASGDLWAQNFILPERMTNPEFDARAKMTADTVRTVELLYGDGRVASSLTTVGRNFFRPHQFYFDPTMRSAHTLRSAYSGLSASNLRGATDHMLSASYLSNSSFTYTLDGTTGNYRGYPSSASSRIKKLGAQYTTDDASNWLGINSAFPHVTSSVDYNSSDFMAVWNAGGDFETGSALTLDGPFIGKSNESGDMRNSVDARAANPDFNLEFFSISYENLNNAPNRQVSSPVILGSLPIGDEPDESWRTLLFSPNPVSPTHSALSKVSPAGNPPLHGQAPEYLILDFFNMPVVEPYAISEPFSTAGRVNMNYQIAPFTYLTRNTALRGVLNSGMLTAAEDRRVHNRKMMGGTYSDGASGPYTKFLQDSGHWGFRYPIHLGETLKQFQKRFDGGDVFRSPAEICSLWLYPSKQPTATMPENSSIHLVTWDSNSTNIKSWWYDNPGGTCKSVTGDNLRERPYSTLYPRLTTKSNTYTVHQRVQTLQKGPGTSPTVWDESKDKVGAEYRGSALVERYIDPSDPEIPDFALPANASKSMDPFYRFRILQMKRFAP